MSTTKRKVPPAVEGAVSAAEALRFAAVANAVMRAPMHAAEQKRRVSTAAEEGTGTPHIGTLREKRLHAAIKSYLCADESCHERPVYDFRDSEALLGKKKIRPVADIFTGEEILEVQTGGFFPLREKLAWYLDHTGCRVTVVHPIPAVRYLSWINPTDGTVLSRRRSPKRGQVKDVAKELYWLSDFIGSPRFSVRLLLIELEEYRIADGWSRDGKRGSSRYERFPTALLGDVTLATAADYAAHFLPAPFTGPGEGGAPVPFTAADYARASGIRGKATYSMLRILVSLGLIEETEEKLGRSRGYRVR